MRRGGDKTYGDQITVAQLLEVAEVELNATYPDKTKPGALSSNRYDGQTLRLRVVYEGHRTAWDPNATYMYRVAANDLEAKVLSSDTFGAAPGGAAAAAAEERELRDLHGLQLLFSQGASLWVFDFNTLLLTLVAPPVERGPLELASKDLATTKVSSGLHTAAGQRAGPRASGGCRAAPKALRGGRCTQGSRTGH